MTQKSRYRQEFGNRRHGKKALFGILLFLTLFLTAGISVGVQKKQAEAAAATITITTKNSRVQKGDTLYIVIKVSSTESIKSFEGYFTYDNSILCFVTGGSVVHGNDDAFLVSDTDREESATEIKYSVKFRARKAGVATVGLKKPYEVIADDDDETKMSVSYSSLDVTVEKKKTVSATKQPQSSGQPNSSGQPQTGEQPQGSGQPNGSAQPNGAGQQGQAPSGSSVPEQPEGSAVPEGSAAPDPANAASGSGIEGGAMPEQAEAEAASGSAQTASAAEKALQRKVKSLKYVVAILVIFCVLMLLLAITFRIRYSKQREK